MFPRHLRTREEPGPSVASVDSVLAKVDAKLTSRDRLRCFCTFKQQEGGRFLSPGGVSALGDFRLAQFLNMSLYFIELFIPKVMNVQ